MLSRALRPVYNNAHYTDASPTCAAYLRFETRPFPLLAKAIIGDDDARLEQV